MCVWVLVRRVVGGRAWEARAAEQEDMVSSGSEAQVRQSRCKDVPCDCTITLTQTLQVHVRHLVGGRARGSRALADERLFEVQAPERLRAISQLLDALSPVFNARPFTS